ncbi:MAG: hypothetical protein ACLUI3_12180 [Christensenellales bacterium]
MEGETASFIMDCGYQRCYRGDELPHLLEQIRAALYLFLSHSHENQSGALPYLLANGFTGRVVLTTETARQLPLGIDDPLVLEGLSVPYAEAQIPGGLTLTWGRSGHCSGSVWYRMAENGRSLFFSGDYYDCARVHARDPIEGIRANLAVLDCDYGMQPGSASRDAGDADRHDFEALADGRPSSSRAALRARAGVLTYICERLPGRISSPTAISSPNWGTWTRPRCKVRPGAGYAQRKVHPRHPRISSLACISSATRSSTTSRRAAWFAAC